jgi:hypothetical protein
MLAASRPAQDACEQFLGFWGMTFFADVIDCRAADSAGVDSMQVLRLGVVVGDFSIKAATRRQQQPGTDSRCARRLSLPPVRGPA